MASITIDARLEETETGYTLHLLLLGYAGGKKLHFQTPSGDYRTVLNGERLTLDGLSEGDTITGHAPSDVQARDQTYIEAGDTIWKFTV